MQRHLALLFLPLLCYLELLSLGRAVDVLSSGSYITFSNNYPTRSALDSSTVRSSACAATMLAAMASPFDHDHY